MSQNIACSAAKLLVAVGVILTAVLEIRNYGE
jgi:hypothetical protein